MTLFGGYSYDGVSAGILVIHRGGKSGGSRWRFLAVTLMMVWLLVYGSYIGVANLGSVLGEYLPFTQNLNPFSGFSSGWILAVHPELNLFSWFSFGWILAVHPKLNPFSSGWILAVYPELNLFSGFSSGWILAVQWVQFWVNIGRSPRTEPALMLWSCLPYCLYKFFYTWICIQ